MRVYAVPSYSLTMDRCKGGVQDGDRTAVPRLVKNCTATVMDLHLPLPFLLTLRVFGFLLTGNRCRKGEGDRRRLRLGERGSPRLVGNDKERVNVPRGGWTGEGATGGTRSPEVADND